MKWQGFLTESKSYMNHPDLWKEWNAQLYLSDGQPDLDYPGWTMEDRRKAALKFWLSFPRAWIRFHWAVVRDWVLHSKLIKPLWIRLKYGEWLS